MSYIIYILILKSFFNLSIFWFFKLYILTQFYFQLFSLKNFYLSYLIYFLFIFFII